MSFDQLVKEAGTPVQRGDAPTSSYRNRVLSREKFTTYLEGTARPEAVGLSLPPRVRVLEMTLNWPGLVVDTLESRLDVEGFLLAGQDSTDDDLWGWWQTNNLDLESTLLHREALAYGRGFIIVGNHPDEGVPAITVHSEVGWAVRYDPRTRNVVEAVRVYLDGDNRQWAAHYHPEGSDYYYKSTAGWWSKDSGLSLVHDAGVPAVVPMVSRVSIGDHVGRSVMTDVLDLTDAASRTLTNAQLAQELLGAPLRGLFGVDAEDLEDADGNPVDAVDLYMGRLLTSENENAKLAQLAGADLRNFTEVLQSYARQISVLTGIPQHYLGIGSENPVSADAMRASENHLVRRVERFQRIYGESWEKAMRIAMAMQGRPIADSDRLETVWRDAATPTMAAKMDAAIKGKESGLYGPDTALKMAGFSDQERKAAATERQDPMSTLGLGSPKPQDPGVAEDLTAMGVGGR